MAPQRLLNLPRRLLKRCAPPLCSAGNTATPSPATGGAVRAFLLPSPLQPVGLPEFTVGWAQSQGNRPNQDDRCVEFVLQLPTGGSALVWAVSRPLLAAAGKTSLRTACLSTHPAHLKGSGGCTQPANRAAALLSQRLLQTAALVRRLPCCSGCRRAPPALCVGACVRGAAGDAERSSRRATQPRGSAGAKGSPARLASC